MLKRELRLTDKLAHSLGEPLFLFRADKAGFNRIEAKLGQLLFSHGMCVGDGQKIIAHVAAEIGRIIRV